MVNTGGRELAVSPTSAETLLLDFWSLCRVRPWHVLDELRPLEEKYADVLVTIGVHSPKFVHEAEHAAVLAAVERWAALHHPVLDDPDLETWKQYAVRAWPTLTVVDPEGYVVAQMSGEGTPTRSTRSSPSSSPSTPVAGRWVAATARTSRPLPPRDDLLFLPGKVSVLPDGTPPASDTAHHSIAHLAAGRRHPDRRIGSGARGLVDGDGESAELRAQRAAPPAPRTSPHGLATTSSWPTPNHAIRGARARHR